MVGLTDQEFAILLATRVSENALSAEELAQAAETTVENAANTLDMLTSKQILKPIESFDDRIVYCWPDNDNAQAIYDEIHGL